MSRAIVIVGIVVNLVIPGLGSLIMGKWFTGLIQLAMIGFIWLVGLLTFGIGAIFLAPVHGLVWLWALIGGLITLAMTPHSASRRH